ncbi:MAG: T9SS type A sorting domain-containing protein, partial [Bacteroidales bacterium]|nr:T9SS type A sorting domain-containing protein [Bacteroidales bacterium]
AVNEAGIRSFYVKDTIVYHNYVQGIKDLISVTPNLMIFPNPVSEIINFKLIALDNRDDMIIRLFDETGRIVSEKSFSFRETDHYTVSASDLISGIYRIIITTKTGEPVARATFVKK